MNFQKKLLIIQAHLLYNLCFRQSKVPTRVDDEVEQKQNQLLYLLQHYLKHPVANPIAPGPYKQNCFLIQLSEH